MRTVQTFLFSIFALLIPTIASAEVLVSVHVAGLVFEVDEHTPEDVYQLIFKLFNFEEMDFEFEGTDGELDDPAALEIIDLALEEAIELYNLLIDAEDGYASNTDSVTINNVALCSKQKVYFKRVSSLDDMMPPKEEPNNGLGRLPGRTITFSDARLDSITSTIFDPSGKPRRRGGKPHLKKKLKKKPPVKITGATGGISNGKNGSTKVTAGVTGETRGGGR